MAEVGIEEILQVFDEVGVALKDEESGEVAIGDDEGRDPDGLRRQDEIGTKDQVGDELQEEVEAARESVSTLRNVVNEMKELLTGPVLKDIALFVGKNLAIGAILYGVSVVLKKMAETEGSGDPNAQTQYQKVSALSELVKAMSEKSSILLKWLQSNQETTVGVGDGITVPLPDLFYQFTVKMNDALDVAFGVAKELQQEISGKISFLVPTTDQIVKIATGAGNFIDALSAFVNFAKEKEADYPILAEEPVTQDDVGELTRNLEEVQQMP